MNNAILALRKKIETALILLELLAGSSSGWIKAALSQYMNVWQKFNYTMHRRSRRTYMNLFAGRSGGR